MTTIETIKSIVLRVFAVFPLIVCLPLLTANRDHQEKRDPKATRLLFPWMWTRR